MGLFKPANQNGAPVSERQLLEQKYNSARSNLLLVVAFTAVNIILLLLNTDMYFLFSASIPYYLVLHGMLFCGKLPAYYYEELGVEIPDVTPTFLVAMVILAVVIVTLYFVAWLLSRNKNVGWMIFALVFFALDTVGMFYFAGISVDSVIDILFHAWVIYYLIVGITSYNKLKNLPEEDPAFEIPAEDSTEGGDSVQ